MKLSLKRLHGVVNIQFQTISLLRNRVIHLQPHVWHDLIFDLLQSLVCCFLHH